MLRNSSVRLDDFLVILHQFLQFISCKVTAPLTSCDAIGTYQQQPQDAHRRLVLQIFLVGFRKTKCIATQLQDLKQKTLEFWFLKKASPSREEPGISLNSKAHVNLLYTRVTCVKLAQSTCSIHAMILYVRILNV